MKKKRAVVKKSKPLELAPDITQEELEVFLQEADEQLQLLDEDIVKLEKGEEDTALLEEIFRAAHTFKGSSGMLGHARMAELTHAMESVLDRVRKKTLIVTTPVIDALLGSLDVLKSLRDEIVAMEECDIDIAAVVAELEKVQEAVSLSEEAGLWEATDSGSLELQLSEEDKEKVRNALAALWDLYKVEVSVSRNVEWAPIRCFQVLNDLSKTGKVITSSPSRADIEAQNVGADVILLYATDQDEEAVRGQLGQIPDIEHIEVMSYTVEEWVTVLGNAPAAEEDVVTEQASAVEEAVTPQRDVNGSGAQTKAASHEARASHTVRIDVQRLDDLMNLVGELSIFHPRIFQISRMLEHKYKGDEIVKTLGETSTNAMKVVDELQEDIMKIRMLPIGIVFNTFPRMVRDLARRADKDIDFIVEGQDTEIDRTVIDLVRDPIVHLLRNAVDHGLESPEARVAAGKPQKGTIRLTAWHEEGYILISARDDGRGIDPERVKRSALQKGVITTEAAAKMSDEEAVDLIFSPGMSTAQKTTEVSGRGVGLDVVKNNIEAMNGVVLVDMKVGEGTNFTLRMPLTLATFQGLLVSSAGTVYAIPLASVIETLKMADLETRKVENGEIMRIRDSIMPLVRLRKVFSVDGEGLGGENYVVVVRDTARFVGLAVDALMEPQDVVVKSLGRFMGEVKGISGASILGDGTVALIMDVPTLMRSALTR